MNEVIFDIKKFCYVSESDKPLKTEPDVSFIPMMVRRKLNAFGRVALYTLYGACGGGEVKLVFASEYGDFERVAKLITQRIEDGEVSPAGFSASVHNASVGLFSLLEGIKTGYNSISAGKDTISAGFLESILSGNALFCYAESLDGLKSVSANILPNPNGEFILCENSDNLPAKADFEDFIRFLEGETADFVTDLYVVKRTAL